MHEIPSESIHLMVTSPPYYNAPFDYPGLFKDYDDFLNMIDKFSTELFRVLAPGRIAAYVTDDMLIEGNKYPVVADITKIMIDNGFRYRDKITWVKPKGYTRISRRSGVILHHPYPMYFYPDNIQESIIIFQKGKFDYRELEKKSSRIMEESKIDVNQFNKNDWYITIWNITNVLPKPGRIEKGIAAFPEEIPLRIIKLYSYMGETVLDPFFGSGTTLKVARDLNRNSVGYELDKELVEIVKKKLNLDQMSNSEYEFSINIRDDAKSLRSILAEKIKKQNSVTKQ